MNIDVNGNEVFFLIPTLVSFVISVFTSTGGVSGAFLLLPFQFSILGFTGPAVSPTNQLYNIVAIPSGVYRYIKEGRMVWPLTWIVVIGTLPGVFIGALIRLNYLAEASNFQFFAGLVLLYIGYRLIQPLLKKTKNEAKNSEERFQQLVKSYKQSIADGDSTQKALPRTKVLKFNFKTLTYEFYGERYTVNTIIISIISFVIGIIGGIYGIGGGAIMAPIYVAIFNLPVYTVAGAALMGTFLTSIAGVAFFQILSPYYPQLSVAPNWILGIMFGIGGFIGMYIGARMQKNMPAKVIKWVLSICILFIALKYIMDFVIKLLG